MRRALPLLVLGLAVHAAPAQAAGCAGARTVPSAHNVGKIRSATLCLLNQQRHARGLPALRGNAQLQRAAHGFSARMVRERFFDHTAPDGTTFDQRIQAAGYSRFRALAENIAWGSGPRSTPVRIVDIWMHSAGHRRNILDGTLRDIGIGIVPGAPLDTGGRSAATYTTDFGRRG